jgi:hypothetical protein
VEFRSLEGVPVGSCDVAGGAGERLRGALKGRQACLSGGLGEHADELVSNIGRERLGGAHWCNSLAPQGDA